MSATAVLLGTAGILLSFLPDEISAYFMNTSANGTYAVSLQLIGALYFAFAMVNWTSRANLIGGIYGRPIAIGNLTHFTIGALALLKAYSADFGVPILIITILYSILAILFGVVFFRHPVKEQ
jgi:Na+-driven multidrug efflux pump